MKTTDFLRQHDACSRGARWALSISDEMSDVWDAMIKEGKHAWLIWTLSRPGVFPESVLRKTACKFIRKTPLSDGRTVWDMLTDERSRKAVEVAEAYADGKATNEELHAARASAHDAYVAANAAARSVAYDVYDDYAAARAAADATQAAAYAARAAADAAHAAEAAYDSVCAAYDAARSVASDAAYDAAKSAQIKMIAEIGNPFRKGK